MKNTISQFFKNRVKKIIREAKKYFINSPFSKTEGLLFYIIFLTRKISIKKSNKTVLIFIDTIDPPGMRLFQLFSQFLYCGYTCYFKISFSRYMQLKRYGKKATLFKGLKPYSNKRKKYSIIASDDKEFLKNAGEESLKIYLNFYLFNHMSNISNNDIFYPLVPHFKYNYPPLEKKILSNALTPKRKIGAFFAGNTNTTTYNADITRQLFDVNTRHETFSHIIEKLPKDILYIPKMLDLFLRDIELGLLENKIVLLDINNFEIPRKHYFEILLQTNFYIHMCGVIYPYCHNQIESMMAGCIPITQFSDFFLPALKHETDSILFKSLDDLIDILLKINKGNYTNTIETMRENIVNYYIEYYSFQSFEKKLSHIIDNKSNYTNYFITTGSNNVIRELLPRQR
jgi:hypothetical protein